MFEQKLNPLSIFRKALFFRTLHHFFCLLDLFAVIFLPFVVLPFICIVHVGVYLYYVGRMSRVMALLAAPNGAASTTDTCVDLLSVLSSISKKEGGSAEGVR